MTASVAASAQTQTDSVESPANFASSEAFTRTGRVDKIARWIQDEGLVPAPQNVSKVAANFLDHLQNTRPEILAELDRGGHLPKGLESELLRTIALDANASDASALREEIASRRLILATPQVSRTEAGTLLHTIKTNSELYYNRFLEGKADDDELMADISKARANGKSSAAAVQKQELTASDIVSEFARRNQTGAAVEKCFGYSVLAKLQSANGTQQDLILTRMRPDRFRLTVKKENRTQLVLASSGKMFWQQERERNPQELTRGAIGSRAYLGEFINPLFGDGKYEFTRLNDASVEGVAVYKIKIVREDRSEYISYISKDRFQEIVRENPDGIRSALSDFREVAGITFAFREEVTDRKGQKAVFSIDRIAINTGVVQSYFEAAPIAVPSVFSLEAILTEPTAPKVALAP